MWFSHPFPLTSTPSWICFLKESGPRIHVICCTRGGNTFHRTFFLVKVNYFWKAFEKLVAMLPAWWGPRAASRATAWCPPQASRAPPLQASCRCPSWIHLNPSQASLSKISRVNLWSRSTLTAWLDLSDWVQSRCQHSPIILAPDLFVGFCCFFFYFAKSATIVNTFSLGGVQLFYLQVTGSWWNATIWKRNLKSSLLFRII